MLPYDSRHCDPERLSLIALGEAADVDTDHLATCADCRAELDALRTTVTVARSGSAADAPVTPPPAVWERVVAELGLSPTAAEPARLPAAPAAGGGGGATVVPLATRRRRPAFALAAAAAVAGVVVGGTATWLATRPAEQAQPTAEILATATLEPLPQWPDARGDARVEIVHGTRVLHVDVTAPASSGRAFREVWLLDRDAKRLVSLGMLPGRSADFVLPAGLDLAAYPVVDVSKEPNDGNPAHSGDSIVRGTLAT